MQRPGDGREHGALESLGVFRVVGTRHKGTRNKARGTSSQGRLSSPGVPLSSHTLLVAEARK